MKALVRASCAWIREDLGIGVVGKHLSPKPLQNKYTILRSKYVDRPDDDINRKIEYKDEELSTEELVLVNTMRDQLDTEEMIPKILEMTLVSMDIILGSEV